MTTGKISIHAASVRVSETKIDGGTKQTKDSFASVFTFKASNVRGSADDEQGKSIKGQNESNSKSSQIKAGEVDNKTAYQDKNPKMTADTKTNGKTGNVAAKASDGTLAAKENIKDIAGLAENANLSEVNEEDSNTVNAVMDLLLQMVQQISELLGVNLDDVKDYIKENSLSFSDLPDINNWKLLVVKADGLNNVSQLLTSDEAFGDLTDISNLIKDTMNSDDMGQLVTGLTDGTSNVKEILDNMSDLFSSVDALTQKLSNFMETLRAKLIAESKEDISKNDAVEAFLDGESKEEPTGVTTMVSKAQALDEGKGSADEESKSGNAFDLSKKSDTGKVEIPQNHSARLGHGETQAINNGVFQNIVESVNELEKKETLPQGVKASDILNQVEEQIKTLHSPEKTSLELTLHPASLGKVAINVTSHAGELQAVLRVENPAARDALTSQITELKLQFENQGLKVDNISVMLSNEGLNQNNSGHPADEGKDGKGQHKNFRGDFGEEEDGVAGVSEAESTMRTLTAGTGVNVDASA